MIARSAPFPRLYTRREGVNAEMCSWLPPREEGTVLVCATPVDKECVSNHVCGMQQNVLIRGKGREELTCEKVNRRSRIARERGDHENNGKRLRDREKNNAVTVTPRGEDSTCTIAEGAVQGHERRGEADLNVRGGG